jgi:TonB family protein
LIWGAAIAIHVLASGIAVLGGSFDDDEVRAAAMPEPPPPAEEVALEETCANDVRLAALARGGLCLGPWGADIEACLDQVELIMRIELSACRGRDEPLAEVAVVPPSQVEKFAAIDPEQLVEELREREKEQPQPPPMPQPQPQQQQPPPPPPPPPEPPRKTQVIETVKPNDEKEPDNARFLAEYNTRVDKQKVARGARNEPMVTKSKPEELTPKDKPKDDPSVKKPPEDKLPGNNDRAPEVKGKLSMRPPGAPSQQQEAPQDAKTRGSQGGAKGPIVADGFVPHSGDHAIEQRRRDPGDKTKGENGAGGGAPRVPDLQVSKETLERVAGGGSVDHLEEVEEGDETALTAKRWVYASFFNRMKRQVAQNWNPQSVSRRIDPTGAKHGFKTRFTEVRVTLSSKGELAKIVVTTPSGVSELDDEAVRAFRAAAPFPNPPAGLVKENHITFAFGFYFGIEQRTAWRVFRQQ